MRPITYPEACADPHLFGPWFEGETWATWRVIDKAIFGLPLDAGELETFRELTGRKHAPTEPASEAWLIVGRRGGKDVKAASIAVYLATIGAELYGFRSKLTRGERGIVQVLAVDRDQARTCLDYAREMLAQPMLARLVKRETAEAIELDNSLAIEITTNDRRRVRGRTVVAAIFDEVAHWRAEATVNPDEEIYAAVMPAMATMAPHAMLIGISSPHARKGLLFRKWKDHYGEPGRVLVVKAPTWVMNPSIGRESEVVTEAYRKDPGYAAAEYGAEWRSDVETIFTLEAVEAVVAPGVFERGHLSKYNYSAFCDPAGGAGQDAMTLAIAHKEGEIAVLDALREVKPPFSPRDTVAEFAALLKRYRISKVVGDRFGGDWPAESFRENGVRYVASDRTKSQIFENMIAEINSGKVELLDHPKMVAQLVSLERTVSRGGRGTIDHPRGGHDDVANVAAGALIEIASIAPRARAGILFWGDERDDLPATPERKRRRWASGIVHEPGDFPGEPDRPAGDGVSRNEATGFVDAVMGGRVNIL